MLGFGLIVLAAVGLFLHEQCKLLPVLSAIYDGQSFIKFIVALIIVLAILTALPEPNSSYLAVFVIVAMLLLDQKRNGQAGLLGRLGVKA